MTENRKEFIKERMAAIFIGMVMLFAVGGWALMNVMPQDTGPEFNVPTIVARELTTDEIVYVLQSGRVLIEYYYLENSTKHIEELPVLEMFANQLDGFVVLEEVPANSTRFEMIGIEGKILDLSGMELTENNLFGNFCSIAIAQPPECLL